VEGAALVMFCSERVQAHAVRTFLIPCSTRPTELYVALFCALSQPGVPNDSTSARVS